LYRRNVVKSALLDGFQTHVIVPGWGTGNVFAANAISHAPGYGVNVDNHSPMS